jgi:hypothetical protein
MSRSSNTPDRDFSAGSFEDKLDEGTAKRLFASRPLGLMELSFDPIVRMRVGKLIALAVSTTKRLRRRRSSR